MKLESLLPGLREPWAQCEAVRKELLALLARVPPGRWLVNPVPGRWSVGQQADHLLRAEVGTSKMVRRIIRGDFAGLTRPVRVALHGSTLAAYPYGPGKAPAGLEPHGLAADEAIAQLASAHSRFFEELRRFQDDDADALAAPDPATGQWFTLAGWVRLQALHEAHHLAQIEEALPALQGTAGE
jgi:hypothetical protein